MRRSVETPGEIGVGGRAQADLAPCPSFLESPYVALRPSVRTPTVCQVLHGLQVGGAEVLAARLARRLNRGQSSRSTASLPAHMRMRWRRLAVVRNRGHVYGWGSSSRRAGQQGASRGLGGRVARQQGADSDGGRVVTHLASRPLCSPGTAGAAIFIAPSRRRRGPRLPELHALRAGLRLAG